jgi:hypothetical protein
MKGPSIFIVIESSGDGYGHGSDTFISWHFDEDEANECANQLTPNEYSHRYVEEVPAPDPIKKKDWR